MTAESQTLTDQIVGSTTLPQQELENSGRLDSFTEVFELERRYHALRYIQGCYGLPDLTPRDRALAPILNPMHGVDQISNQFAPFVLDAFMREDPEEALQVFRDIEPHTIDQQMVTLANDEQFMTMFRGLKMYLIERDGEMDHDVRNRLDPSPNLREGRGQIAWNDRYQFNGNETERSLNALLKSGLALQINESGLPLLDNAVQKVGTGPLPLIEILKNERMVSINGLGDSKISLAVHDAMDHLWLFNLLHEKGFNRKFTEFFDSIGNPAYTDIYKREGEVVAAIGFGVRCATAQEHGFIPLIDAGELRTVFERYFDEGRLEPRHMDAFRILRGLSHHSREWQSLGFSYSNNKVELAEQKRKHGKIKMRDPKSHQIVGEFSELDPDYIALFVELHHELFDSKNKTRNHLFMFHILLEEYLQGISDGSITQAKPFNVKVHNLDTYDYAATTIPADRLRWMYRNYGFTAVRDAWI